MDDDELLMAPEWPPQVGGLATPLGVYMTSGHHRAGAGDLGLFLTGVAMTLLFAGVLWGIVSLEHWLGYQLPDMGLFLVLSLGFLGALRVTPLAGLHAAEHQAIAALEMGLPLTPEVVRRMSRVHPRCGSNVLAIGLLAQGLLLAGRPWLETDSPAAVLVALGMVLLIVSLWRPLGDALQALFTTRVASDRQLAGAIAAALQLLDRCREGGGRRAPGWRRLWNRGLLQLLAGWLATWQMLELTGLW